MTRRLRLGPGLIVTAAFIGPGTVTTATLAGAHYGVTLLWALAFATVATIILQEMSVRLGLVTHAGLAQALRAVGGPRWLGPTLAGLAAVAVVSGVAAYQAGNLTGAGLGLEATGALTRRQWALGSAVGVVLLLWTGRYRVLERTLIGCVAIMGLVFLATAFLVAPSLGSLVRGAVVPTLPPGAGTLTALGLVGTTIVPYNLFLHAAAALEKWPGREDLASARWDLGLAIALGGIVSGAIVVTAAAALNGADVQSATDMAAQLDPLLGPWARRAFAIGLAAAGLSSAITAPLAAAYATMDAMGRERNMRSGLARAVWGGTVAIGTAVTLSGTRPLPLILFAQVANGLLLPVVALFLVGVMNDRRRLGNDVNGWAANLAGIAVVLLCAVLGVRGVMGAFR